MGENWWEFFFVIICFEEEGQENMIALQVIQSDVDTRQVTLKDILQGT